MISLFICCYRETILYFEYYGVSRIVKMLIRLFFLQIKVYPVGSEEVFNYVPRKLMPVEIGGLGCSHNQLNGK